ncbi:MAG: UDP-N-acetylmuramoyl-L-alanyl-D-glutamate--2,6-diaminopimelate ligase [Xanthomarina sp.]|uniref:UDP-N-acetylmuramoyl-L-alanyl-D-glutamate--2,6-diaminopimelate ligase n=1 Tax=Xanthomarina gelatinilytica TaxID=1137281 RepID=A0A3D6BS34_9FLAO|nr:UDP-N-acetylmuramoyl-L-alanyl-D-glutamate--2,6-diaminopimelate ligase [Xanthomarina sp.]MAL23159.1 UDP-N-acetylmuramoyl-L-alanyl-D-glutamate--2,6-diaminopimelate ligase [Xanthomarina sp.]MBF60604.1 UDP-N-acetylmuramoyl-L-alanyl-D-glutamate--2,6-diaminopimelate ligase [Xanthomarina sp.]HAB27989.1 UDP-N-acetylmuramoyl-L-alanyl-D-glutamate--2,6-diaminopimelate ligase [Xanthomarina gelatinilytica]HCY81447.1 UDP-N-acetylmuramoyl-L-alanyl-D-glutamate--2,6-diaminopimelate ligase [Xanthomarina gelat
MMILKDILYKVTLNAVVGSTNLSVKHMDFDSRNISEHDVFVAIKGTVSNGHEFIDIAIEQGAIAIVCETLPENIKQGITYVQVESSSKALAIMASNFYQNPSENLKLVGVTGTNGKTTIASLLYQLFKKAGFKVGLLSTVRIMVDNKAYKATHTTPDSLTINKYLKEMNDKGVAYCFMEVSSHGIHQHRTEGLHFQGGIFTNLSHDHLDYHDTFAEYRDVKKTFFDQLPATAFALVNMDDKNGLIMLQNTKAKKYTYALKGYADYRAQILENQLNGLLLKINESEVWTRLIGNFNAYNVLAIYATAELLGLEKVETLRMISELESVAGRFQYLISDNKITAIVDYAHTPDALKNVLETINSIRTKNEELITVFGCGGNRDKTKRPKMGHIASALSSKVIITSDNPRNEAPESIMEDIEKGIEPQNFKKVLSIADRKQAIKTACQMANPNDIILIAGKGHETYQEIKGERFDFDDFKIVKEFLKQLEK